MLIKQIHLGKDVKILEVQNALKPLMLTIIVLLAEGGRFTILGSHPLRNNLSHTTEREQPPYSDNIRYTPAKGIELPDHSNKEHIEKVFKKYPKLCYFMLPMIWRGKQIFVASIGAIRGTGTKRTCSICSIRDMTKKSKATWGKQPKNRSRLSAYFHGTAKAADALVYFVT
nr:hypothetical protein [Tanacetum cinerariifolium]